MDVVAYVVALTHDCTTLC